MPTAELPPTRRPGERRGSASKGDRREQALLDALESLLTECPLAKVSVGRIAARAGVGRTAFYFYFASREAALAALAQRSFAPVYDVAHDWFYGDDDFEIVLPRALEGVVDLWIEQTHLFTAIIDAGVHEEAMHILWREQIEGVARVIAQRIDRDAQRDLTWPGLDAEGTARGLAWMTERQCYVYLRRRPPSAQDRDHVLSTLVHLWSHSIYRQG